MLTCSSVGMSADQQSTSAIQRLIRGHCLDCHADPDSPEGGVELSSMAESGIQNQPSQAKQLLKVLVVLQDREMPPADQPPVSPQLRQEAINELTEARVSLLSTMPFSPTAMRRMNRFEYNNAVVDLLMLERDIFQLNERLMRRRNNYFDPASGKMPDTVRVSCRPLSKDIDNERPEGFRGVAAFPQDQRAEHGFDNRADHLTLSPLLMESFLQLSESIAFSPDLNAEECGCWDILFFEPDTKLQRDEWLHERTRWLLQRAFRRPVDEETVLDFVAVAASDLDQGASVEHAMRRLVSAVLAMPRFLYFHERPTNSQTNVVPGREPITDFELADRLARFFWSSIPDERLQELAQSGRLQQPNVLQAELDRMLADRRTARFCENFAAQWLQLDRLITAIPDRERFPWFYYNGYRTSMHMMPEPLLLFETVFVEDRSVLQLLDSDFTWQSDMLAANYDGNSEGRRDVKVQTFQRVSVEDARRGGVITTAAVMTMTSTPIRTQPITRGAWVNTVIFNDPPDPPPADVPPLPEHDAEEFNRLTIREQLSLHRQRADCAGCHNRIDPLGFALENYGPTGVWRDQYENGRDVDVSGVLFNSRPFSSIEQFKDQLLQERERFLRGFVAHLLSYGLGRALGPADELSLDAVVADTVDGNDSLRSVLKAVAVSPSFLSKNTLADHRDPSTNSHTDGHPRPSHVD